MKIKKVKYKFEMSLTRHKKYHRFKTHYIVTNIHFVKLFKTCYFYHPHTNNMNKNKQKLTPKLSVVHQHTLTSFF